MESLTAAEREAIVNGEKHPKYEFVATQELHMDSHGCNVVLAVLRVPAEHRIVGFTYRYSSEEPFFEDDPDELIGLIAREVTEWKYFRKSGKEWGAE